LQTVLFVGAGRHQRRAIAYARGRGLRLVAIDGDEAAPGLAEADVGVPVDFSDVEAVIEVGRREQVDGVLTISADRAVPIVAAVADALGLPGIGVDTARAMTHKATMRARLAEHGVPQPPHAVVHDLDEARAASARIGFPAVLKPVDSGGQRGVFQLDAPGDIEADLPPALAESATGAAILERFQPGMELNGLAVARDGEVTVLTLSDRRRPPGIGFGVGWIHVYPPTLTEETIADAAGVAAAAVKALGLRDGIAFPQLIASGPGEVTVVEVAARVPGGQMADLARHAVGIDVVDLQLRLALGEELPDELVLPRFSQPLAVRFFTAQPGPLPTGRVRGVSGLESVLAAPGVVQADVFLTVGEEIRPVRLDGDRRGYVIAVGDSNLAALERAEAAVALLRVEVE
jgi:biotin carboxylase